MQDILLVKVVVSTATCVQNHPHGTVVSSLQTSDNSVKI
jgi:hypothetical protein